MLKSLPATLKGCLAVTLIILVTLTLLPILLLFAFIKLLVPVTVIRKYCTVIVNWIAYIWLGFNNLLADTLHHIEWQIEGHESLSRSNWYLVTCNHQSWADIPAIQHALNSRIPLMKFFLKQQLIWVPLLGVAWWALDFPFMRRFTREQVAKNPALKGKDLETTRRACEKFEHTPVTVFNFMEGTRFTPAKHKQQNSPYRHLLKPRAGGTAFVLSAMGDILHQLLDVTIVYPEKKHSFWDYLCGRIHRIVIHIRTIDIPPRFLGMDYQNDAKIKEEFQLWISDIWSQKDQRIMQLMQSENMPDA